MEFNYYDIYSKRINRYGLTPNDRLENARRENFKKFRAGSPHLITFLYEGVAIDAVFEPYKQNERKTIMYLLCEVEQSFPTGTILSLDGDRYMVYYLDERKKSGYNRYVLLKMSHTITWLSDTKEMLTAEAYMFSQREGQLEEELVGGRHGALFFENLTINSLILPLNRLLTTVGTYVIITTEGITQHFRMIGFDIVTTPGIMQVGLDPTYERDLTPPPIQEIGEPDASFYWLRGE